MLNIMTSSELPDREGENPFLDLHQLLRIGTRPGLLASAVEVNGVYGLDRYGRFIHFARETDGAMSALEAIAKARSRFLEEGTYDLDDLFDGPLGSFGWTAKLCPDFLGLDPFAVPGAAKAVAGRNPKAMIYIVGAMLKFIEGKLRVNTGAHPDFKSRPDFALLIQTELNDDLSGLSADNLLNLFTEFNRLTDEGIAAGRPRRRKV